MPLWIPITLAAAFLQNARSTLQARLRGRVGPTGATFVRFLYAAPFALAFAALGAAYDGAAPATSGAWLLWTAIGALSQILATAALLAAIDRAGFAVGTGYSKTEPILAALVGALLLGEAPPALAALGIVVGVIGVWIATIPPKGLGRAVDPGGLAFGIASAALFGLSAVSYRAASLALLSGSVGARAGGTLAVATLMQVVGMGLWMALREPDELKRTLAAWRPGFLAGAAGAFASLGWFSAMTLEPAAHVRALAQIELLFAAITAWLWFSERPTRRALLGLALLGGGTALLLTALA